MLRRTRALLGALAGTAPCPPAAMVVSPHPAHPSGEKIPGSGPAQLRGSLFRREMDAAASLRRTRWFPAGQLLPVHSRELE